MGASESKLAFKEDIFRLAGEENIPIDSQWWSRVRLFLSHSRVPSGFNSRLDIPQLYRVLMAWWP